MRRAGLSNHLLLKLTCTKNMSRIQDKTCKTMITFTKSFLFSLQRQQLNILELIFNQGLSVVCNKTIIDLWNSDITEETDINGSSPDNSPQRFLLGGCILFKNLSVPQNILVGPIWRCFGQKITPSRQLWVPFQGSENLGNHYIGVKIQNCRRPMV